MSKQSSHAMAKERAKDFKGTLKMLVKRLWQFKWHLIIALTFAICAAILNVLGPRFLNDMMTMLFSTTGYQFSEVTRIGIIIVIMYVVAGILGYFQGFLMSKVSVGISKKLRSEISVKINKLPLKYFDKHSYGDVLSRVTNDIDTVGMTLERIMSSLVTSMVTIIGIPVVMFTISWQLTLISLLQIPLALLIVFLVVKFNQKYFVRQQKYLGDINGYIEEHYSAHTVIKAFNGEEKAQEEFNAINSKLRSSSMKAQFFSGLMHPIVNFASNVIYVLICLVGGWIAISTNNIAFLATIITFLTYSKLFNQPISQIGSVMGNLQSTMAAAERVFEFLKEEEQPDESEKTLTIKDVKGKVEFKHVNFGYDKDKQIIFDFNFTANPGEKIAIVGQTGAGKTTIVNLLMRFYEIDSGEILIDGVSTKDMNRSYVRSLFGMVLQDTWLFEGTIKENLRFERSPSNSRRSDKFCRY